MIPVVFLMNIVYFMLRHREKYLVFMHKLSMQLVVKDSLVMIRTFTSNMHKKHRKRLGLVTGAFQLYGKGLLDCGRISSKNWPTFVVDLTCRNSLSWSKFVDNSLQLIIQIVMCTAFLPVSWTLRQLVCVNWDLVDHTTLC